MSVAVRLLLVEAFRRFAYVPAKAVVDTGLRALRFLQALFGLQTNVVDIVLSGAKRRLAVFCTRRAGKTTLFGTLLLAVAFTFPGVLCTYFAITRLRAKQLLWDELKRIDREYALGVKFNETELEARTGNGSIIRLTEIGRAHV